MSRAWPVVSSVFTSSRKNRSGKRAELRQNLASFVGAEIRAERHILLVIVGQDGILSHDHRGMICSRCAPRSTVGQDAILSHDHRGMICSRCAPRSTVGQDAILSHDHRGMICSRCAPRSTVGQDAILSHDHRGMISSRCASRRRNGVRLVPPRPPFQDGRDVPRAGGRVRAPSWRRPYPVPPLRTGD